MEDPSSHPRGLGRAVAESLAVGLAIGLIGWVDHRTGPEIGFSLFYLVVVVAAAWWLRPATAWLAAALATASWFAADVLWYDPGHLPVSIWNGFTRLVIFGAAVAVILIVRRERQRDRLNAERAVAARRVAEEDRALLAEAVEQSSELVTITDVDGAIEYVNPAFERITGYAEEEVLGRNPRLLNSGRNPPETYREMWASLGAGEPWSGLLVNRRKDGTLYEQETTIFSVRDRSGRVTNYVSVSRDVTRERRVASQVAQGQRMEAIGRLAGGVAHDFNNLLTVILGSAQLALEALGPDDPARSEIGEIEAAGRRAADLTRQLLAFGRRQVLEPRLVSVNEVVSEMHGLLERLIDEDVRLETVPGPDVGLVSVDPGQLEQVVANLAVNARDAMPDGGILTIETANVDLDEAYAASHAGVRPGPYVVLAVSDTGRGMDAETRAHLFEPFFTTRPDVGHGLGLATVHGIVEQSGGHIFVYSEPGEGTTFRIYLPRVPGEALEAPPAEIEPAKGSETVFVIEDDGAVRTVVARFLVELGYAVLVAAAPEEALAVARDEAVALDLLVTDVVMPTMSGPELAARIAETRPGLAVLYVSGYPDRAIVRRDVLDPGVAFLQKPFSRDALGRKVREVLDRRG